MTTDPNRRKLLKSLALAPAAGIAANPSVAADTPAGTQRPGVFNTLHPLVPQGLTVLAGRPNNGKSSLAMNIALEHAARTHQHAWYIGAQPGGVEAPACLIPVDCSAHLNIIDRPKAEQERNACRRLTIETADSAGTVHVIDPPGRLYSWLDAADELHNLLNASRSPEVDAPGLIVLDEYDIAFQGMVWGHDSLPYITAELARFSSETGITVVMLARLTPFADLPAERQRHPDARPRPSDFSELGRTMDHVTMALALYRPELYISDDYDEEEREILGTYLDRDANRNVLELGLAKSPYGDAGNWCMSFRLSYDPHTRRYRAEA